MLDFSYTLSEELKKDLQDLDFLRKDIALAPLSARTKLRLRWEAKINRIYWALLDTDNPPSRKEIIKALTAPVKGRLKRPEQEVLNYKEVQDYIFQEWLATSRNVTPRTIINIHYIVYKNTGLGKITLSERNENSLRLLLDYLQSGQEHPIIQAGIAFVEILRIFPFSFGNDRIASLLSYLFLYKYGFDFRGFLVLEEYWHENQIELKRLLEEASSQKNLTSWLKFFTDGLVTQLEKAKKSVSSQYPQLDIPISYFDLNDRQKGILNLLDEPNSTISNKKVQKLFKVSQITASRDLAKLVSLGTIFSHGKGRSTSYTKV